MDEHAVFWRECDDPATLYAGGVTVERTGVRLRGSDGVTRVVQTVPATQLAGVAPGGEESIADYPSLRLELRNGRALIVAAALGAAVLAEVADNITSLLPLG